MGKIRLFTAFIAIALLVGLNHSNAFAVPIVFNLGYGGTVSYGGGPAPLTTSNGLVTSVGNGTTTTSITGGALNFTTGTLNSLSLSSPFEYKFNSGGSLSINGNAGSGSAVLMTGNFADITTFSCCTGGGGTYTSSFSGLLNINYVDPNLANLLAFNPPPNGGSIAQVQIFFGTAPTAGAAFSGTQAGGAITANDTASVPEPTSLILLGAGLMGFALVGRKLRKNTLS
ncbi:MAG TPA: PEP-CTERM sorting domain-containing protein [Nitrospiria bacterium]|jgi:hypothetical protein